MSPLRIDYIEFQTSALADTKGFFARAFGWSHTDYGPNYASFSGAGEDGGYDGSAAPEGANQCGPVLVVLKAEDLDAAERAVVAAGGTIVKPAYGFPGGKRFHFREPGGNVLAVWSEK